ncbi:MAG: efflux RND transporter periplasmic adaptor subunit [Candidatus Eisenbacteria bacterium]
MKIRKRTLWIGIGVLVLLGLVGANLRPKSRSSGPEVKVETVGLHRVEAWVRAPGRIQAVSRVQVSSNVMGRVAELAVEEGDPVRAGDLLLRLDDERYRSQVAQYRAAIQAAEAQRALSEAQEKEAKLNLERSEKLRSQDLQSEQEAIAIRTRAEVATAQAEAAREEVRRAKAALAQAEKDLKETVFYSPMDGVVTALNIKVGENVVTGTMNNPGTVILTLSDLSAIEVVATVDETDVVHVRIGQRARVLVDALPDTVLEGTVTRVGQSGRGTTGAAQEATSFEVAVLLQHPHPALRPGMNADVEILTGEREATLSVPLQALSARPASVVDKWKREREEKLASGEDGGKGKARVKAEAATAAQAPDAETDAGTDAGAGAGAEPSAAAQATADEAADTTSAAARQLQEGVFLMENGKARFVPLDLGIRGETHVEVAGDVQIGSTLIVGPYKTLRRLKDGEAVRLEKKKKGSKEKKDEDGA